MVKLREYQQRTKDKAEEATAKKVNTMFHLPTGAGKTIVFLSIAADAVAAGKKVIIIAHSEELVLQPAEKAKRLFNLESGIIKAGFEFKAGASLYCASVQTLSSKKNISLINVIKPDLLIIDEAHRSEAASYKKIIEAASGALVFGFSASPERITGALSDVYKGFVSETSIKELESKGFLVPAKCLIKPLVVPEIEKKQLSKGKEYSKKDLAIISNYLLDPLKIYQKEAGNKSIIFCSSVKQAAEVAESFEKAGEKVFLIESKDKKRSEKIKKFEKTKEKAALINCSILIEGFDSPAIDTIINLKPTKSRRIYLQIAGRAARPAAGKKQYLFIDLTNTIIDLGLPNQKINWKKHFFEGRKRKEKAEKVFFEEKTGKIKRINALLKTETYSLIEIDPEKVRMKVIRKCKKDSYFAGISALSNEAPTAEEVILFCALYSMESKAVEKVIKRLVK